MDLIQVLGRGLIGIILRLISRGALPVERIVTSQLGFDEIVENGFDRLIDPAGDQVKVLASPAK